MIDDDDIDFIPLKNLPDSGLVAYTYEPWEEGEPTKANNVLINLLDELEDVSVVGRTKDGELAFASSMGDPDDVAAHLVEFMKMLESIKNNGENY